MSPLVPKRTRKRVQIGQVIQLDSRRAPTVVLAIDPGESSGVAIFEGQSYVRAWEVHTPKERRDAVVAAQQLSLKEGKPLIVAIESWGNFGGVRTAIGLGEARGRWLEQLAAAEVHPRDTHLVHVSTWRSRIYGPASSRISGKESWKAIAIQEARIRWRVELGPDAAEAAMIGLFATGDPEIQRKASARRRGKSAT